MIKIITNRKMKELEDRIRMQEKDNQSLKIECFIDAVSYIEKHTGQKIYWKATAKLDRAQGEFANLYTITEVGNRCRTDIQRLIEYK